MANLKFKIVMAGENGVGKSSLIRRFVLDEFSDDYLVTLGTKVSKKELVVQASRTPTQVLLNIWDVMGSPGLRYLLRDSYFANARAVLMVCDVTRPGTLLALEDWVAAVHRTIGDVPCVVVGNKVDLADERSVSDRDLALFARRHGFGALKTSAKTGAGVEAAFVEVTRATLRRVHPTART